MDDCLKIYIETDKIEQKLNLISNFDKFLEKYV